MKVDTRMLKLDLMLKRYHKRKLVITAWLSIYVLK